VQAHSKKTWVIPDDDLPRRYRPHLTVVGSTDRASRSPRPSRDERMAVPAVLLLAMTYLPGPLAALVVPDAGGRMLKACALLFGAAWGVAVWQSPNLPAVFRAGPWALAALGAVLVAASVLGFAAWARTVARTGRELKPRLPRFPRWVHLPPVILVLGACFPGMGLLLAGRTRRAGLAVWSLLPVLWCGVVIAMSPAVWNLHLARGWERAMSSRLEVVFIASAVAGLCGLLLWTVQALDGMRLEIAWRERGRRPRSDWMAGVLLAALVALLISANPASVAMDLDTVAQAARNDDLLLCPAGLTWAASRMDPSRPLYDLHLAQVYEALGWTGRADAVRASLEARWRPYEAARSREHGAPEPMVVAPVSGLGPPDVPVD
jgi:hypothetical protein